MERRWQRGARVGHRRGDRVVRCRMRRIGFEPARECIPVGERGIAGVHRPGDRLLADLFATRHGGCLLTNRRRRCAGASFEPPPELGERAVGVAQVAFHRAEADAEFLGHLALGDAVDPVPTEYRRRPWPQRIERFGHEKRMLAADQVALDGGRVRDARQRAAIGFAPVALAPAGLAAPRDSGRSSAGPRCGTGTTAAKSPVPPGGRRSSARLPAAGPRPRRRLLARGGSGAAGRDSRERPLRDRYRGWNPRPILNPSLRRVGRPRLLCPVSQMPKLGSSRNAIRWQPGRLRCGAGGMAAVLCCTAQFS